MTNKRNYHDNLLVPMFQYALTGDKPIVQAYHADLGHDAVRLSWAEPGDCFLWGPREHGSHLFLITDPDDPITTRMLHGLTVKPQDWHMILVEKKICGGRIAAGRIQCLHCTDVRQLADLIDASNRLVDQWKHEDEMRRIRGGREEDGSVH